MSGRNPAHDPRSNAMARAVSERLARMVLDSEGGVRPYPGLFGFRGDIRNVGEASPDGRRADDFLAFGVGPSTAARTTATSVASSASHVAHELGASGNPLAITLEPSDLLHGNAANLVRQLVTSYFQLGGFHVHFSVTSAHRLRRAQADPVAHRDLTVRVGGFSVRFVMMDERC